MFVYFLWPRWRSDQILTPIYAEIQVSPNSSHAFSCHCITNVTFEVIYNYCCMVKCQQLVRISNVIWSNGSTCTNTWWIHYYDQFLPSTVVDLPKQNSTGVLWCVLEACGSLPSLSHAREEERPVISARQTAELETWTVLRAIHEYVIRCFWGCLGFPVD